MEEIPSLAEVGEGRNLISQTLRSLTDTTGAENIVKSSIQLAKIWLNLLACNTPCRKGGRVRLGVDFPMARNGNVLLRVCDVWASRLCV